MHFLEQTISYIYVVLTLYLKEAHLFTFQNGRTCFHRLLRARANERLYVMQLEIFLAINFSVKCAMCDVFKHISVAFAQCTNESHEHFNVDNASDAYAATSF